jgi:hypothetical protein
MLASAFSLRRFDLFFMPARFAPFLLFRSIPTAVWSDKVVGVGEGKKKQPNVEIRAGFFLVHIIEFAPALVK